MKTRQTSKQSTKKISTRNAEIRPPVRTSRTRWRGPKIGLLLFLLGSLALFFVLHFIVGYAQSLTGQPPTCARLVQGADYPRLVNLRTPGQQMSAVQMVDELDGGSPAALVQVTTASTPPTLDVSIFGCTMQAGEPRLAQIFSRGGLVRGIVTVTPRHTLLLESLDTRLASDLVPFLQPLQQNIYQEYTWRQGAFVQVPYPSFYPVSSQAEAEELQRSANGRQNVPWRDPLATALQMSKDLLQWSPAPEAQVLTRSARAAVVQLTRQSPRVLLVVTLKQLVASGTDGLWFVTDARTRGITITRAGTLNEPLPSPQVSPLRFGGAGALIDGHTTATLFDHTMAPVNKAVNMPVTVHADSSYSGSLPYHNLSAGQQGVLLISSLPETKNLKQEAGQVLLAGVLLG